AHTIDAVDVRVVKSVDDSTFEQGTHARFTLALAASEYTSAVIPGPATRPYRLIDRMEDGICPVFPVGTPVQHTPGNPHSSPGAPVPNLVLGDPLNPAASHFNAIADWNQALIDHSVASDCEWGAAIDPTYALEGAQIVGL